jgi:hypothetical protein
MVIHRRQTLRFEETSSTVRAVAICCLAVVLSCTGPTSRRQGEALEPAGHIVLGDRSARYWGLTAGVVYREFGHASLPQVVATSVDSWVAGYRYDRGCTRYFQAGVLFLVAATSSCADSKPNAAQPEHVQIVAFDSAGGAFRVSISDSWDGAITMSPRQVQ